MTRPRLDLTVCQCPDPDTGERCGRTYPHGRDRARAAGWRLGQLPTGEPDAMCRRCARPDPALVRLCHDLTQPSTRE